MKIFQRILAVLTAAVLVVCLSVMTMAQPEPQGDSPADQAAGESAGEPAGESGGESGGGESGGSESSQGPAEPVFTDRALENPDQAITLDGVAMGQVRQLITTASAVYDAGVMDEALSTMDGMEEKDGVTYLTINENDTNGIVVRNTGAFVLGGETDPELVAEKINFSYITGSYYPDWEAFCQAMGYDSSKDLEAIAADLVENGQASSYTNLGLTQPEPVVLNDYVIDVSGTGSNDMGGFGAAVYVSDNAAAQFNHFHIITRGPGRGTVFTRFAGEATFNDSTIYAVSDSSLQTMQGCPPGLFIEGKVRATNAVGASIATYNNSTVVSQGWGALSTDSDDLYTDWNNPTQLHINDSYIAVLTSGYGAYSDGAARDYFTGSAIDVPDYGAVETGSGIVSFDNCILNTGMYGVMTHSGNSVGDIVFKDSQLHVGEAGVMLRDTANKVLFENCTIDFDGTLEINPDLALQYGADMEEIDREFGTVNGVDETYAHTVFKSDDSRCIAKLIHNSDPGSGTEKTGAAPVVTISGSEMKGDILNTAAMEGDEYTATSGPAGEGVRTPRSLEVVLQNSAVTGAISLGQDEWEVTNFASGENTFQTIGFAAATNLGAFHDDGYGLKLTLSEGSVWTADRDSYLTELVIDETSSIIGADGGQVIMTVDGEEVEIVPGEYRGEIVICIS